MKIIILLYNNIISKKKCYDLKKYDKLIIYYYI